MTENTRPPAQTGGGPARRAVDWLGSIARAASVVTHFTHGVHIPGTTDALDHQEKGIEKLAEKVKVPRRYRVGVMVAGATAALAGFYAPWSGYTYDPPPAFAAAHPLSPSPYLVYQQFYDGVSTMWFASGLNGNAWDPHIVIDVAEVFVVIVLMLALGVASASSSLSGIRYVVVRVLTFLVHAAAGAQILIITFGDDVKGVNQTLARMKFAQDYGGSRLAAQASQYWNFHIGIGMYLMLGGGGLAFLASFLPERRLSTAAFSARPRWYRACANFVGKVGDFAVGGMYVLLILTVAIVAGIIVDRWLISKGVIRF